MRDSVLILLFLTLPFYSYCQKDFEPKLNLLVGLETGFNKMFFDKDGYAVFTEPSIGVGLYYPKGMGFVKFGSGPKCCGMHKYTFTALEQVSSLDTKDLFPINGVLPCMDV